MYCKYCGADIPDDSEFCEKCGKKLKGAINKKDVFKEKPQAGKKPAKKINKLAIILGTTIPVAIIIVVLSILASLGFFTPGLRTSVEYIEPTDQTAESTAVSVASETSSMEEIMEELEKEMSEGMGTDEETSEETSGETASEESAAETTNNITTSTDTEKEDSEKEKDNITADLYTELDNISEEYNSAWNNYKASYEQGPGYGVAQYDDPEWIAFDETYLAKQKELLGKLKALDWQNYIEERDTIIHCANTLCVYFQDYINSAKNYDKEGFNANWDKWANLYFGDFTDYYNSVLEKLNNII